eukprot:TRINITY_DN9362_c0_g2_i2.p1 TRINITY_DN9362_c0_g2~~TRINITY_DN9362_c0_g2_i2.p1  ORF type:complete len:152 (-),score=31.25 TRINITY_DN9362_c0_g2_i2:62-517(-)
MKDLSILIVLLIRNSVADLVIKIKERPHERYKRRKDDLIYQHRILLSDAICANTFELETIDHRILTVSLDRIVVPSTKKLVEGEGMPVCKTAEKDVVDEYKEAPKSKGNLWITFDIVFPQKIRPEHKELLKELLTQCLCYLSFNVTRNYIP